MEKLNPVVLALIGTMITLAGTTIGSAFVFFTKKNINEKMQKFFLGLAAGVMIAASIWSLLLPAIDYAKMQNVSPFLPCCIGFMSGGILLYMLDKLLPHEHTQTMIPEGPKSDINPITKLIFAVTLHNFPEGMAVGLAFALAAMGYPSITIASAMAFAIGIAIQNLPEGAIISLPLRAKGYSREKTFFCGFLSGIVEPIAGVSGAFIVSITLNIIPWILSFAAGAMIYVVVDELIPEIQGKRNDIGTFGAMIGFIIMMALDITL